MNYLYLLLLTTLLSLSACRSASKAYEKGDYNDAIELAIKKLQKDPYDHSSRETLKKAYTFAVNRHEEKIRDLSSGNTTNRYDHIYQEYRLLQGLYDKISRYPSIQAYVKPTNYNSYIDTYRDKAAEAHAEKGLAWMEEGKKSSYRQAYEEFRAAQRYKPGDVDLKRKAEEAYDAATVHVLVLPMDPYNNSYYYSNSSYRMRNFQDELLRSLNFNHSNNFVKFHTQWDDRTRNGKPDEVLEMRLGRIQIGQPYDERSVREVSAEVVIKEVVHKKDSVTKEYGKVYAKITTTRRTLVSEADLFVISRDADGRTMWSDNFRGEHQWQTEFATYTGDERALSANDKKQLNQREDRAPEADDITDQLLRKISNDLSYRLRNYYQRYQ
ncbi:MAG TPA: hypothetical protein VHK69_05565 [Chitinophagaceae bacterium]|nr:hypothetical protein [Chitinophagaceae bacterium]